MSPSSRRWSPTPEQIMILEEMYKSGVRTPNANQIQKITAHLSFYGRIEGKNVFYWFQNHKARDRQKLRKKLTKQLQLIQQHQQLLLLQDHHHLFPPPVPAPAAGLHHEFDTPADYLIPLKAGTDDGSGSSRTSRGANIGGGDDGGGGNGGGANNNTDTCKLDHNNVSSSFQNYIIKSSSSSSSLANDWRMMTTMMSSVDPTCTLPCCRNNNYRPLKTLELFPVTSPAAIHRRHD